MSSTRSDQAAATADAPSVTASRMVDGFDHPQAPQWQRYLDALLRAKWILLSLTLLGLVAGVAAADRIKSAYRSHATLWIEVTERGAANQGPIRTGELLQSYAWVELLRSFTVLDHAIRERRLYAQVSPAADSSILRHFELAELYQPGQYRLAVANDGREFRLETPEGQLIERGQVGGPVGRQLGFLWTPTAGELRPGMQVEIKIQNIRDLANALGEQLSAQMLDRGNFLRLSLDGATPEETAATLNALTDRFVALAAQLKRAKLDELTAVLAEQLRYSEENLRTAESELESFRVRTITLPSEDAAPVAAGIRMTQDPVLSSYFDLKINRDQLSSDREALERVLQQVPRGDLTVDALAPIMAVQGSSALMGAIQELNQRRTDLRALEQRYTADYPPVRRLREEIEQLEQETIPTIAGELRRGILAQEQLLDSRIGSASRELEQIPPRAIEEARLERRVQIAGDLHSTLRQRYEEARLASASSIPDVRVLDRAAVPTQPIRDQRMILILIAVGASLGLGVGGVLVRERLDKRVRYPEEISQKMGVPVLGAIPRLVHAGQKRNLTEAGEAFRELRLGVVHAHGTAGPIVLTVTSPQSGDGKSFVVVNLAAAFAQCGQRTLIIDADVRRGALHRALQTERSPGLMDYLTGSTDAGALIQTTAVPGMCFIGAGARTVIGPELLGSSKLGKLLQSLRPSFDVILVDSPPLGSGVDPYVLSTLTHNALLVFRTGVSDRALAEAKLEVMDRLPVRVIGAVLNDHVGSGAYRYYNYLPGYEATDETRENSQPFAALSSTSA